MIDQGQVAVTAGDAVRIKPHKVSCPQWPNLDAPCIGSTGKLQSINGEFGVTKLDQGDVRYHCHLKDLEVL